MGNSLGTVPRINRGEQSQTARTATPDCARWLAAFFVNTSAKKIANDAGINLRAAENVKQGRNGLTMAHLENLCNSNPDFRTAWFAERCGGKLKASPEQVALAYRLLNSIERGEFSE